MPTDQAPGHVFLVGAGPGDPDLLTVKALRLIASADIVVHDRLVSDAVLALIPQDTRKIDVGKRPDHHPFPQANINALLVSLAAKNARVVRLKGGDPYVFGRGSEEAAALREANVPYSVVPGITSAQGIAATTGVPLTHRGLASSVRLVTGHCRAGHELDLDWDGLADPDTTLIIYMGRGHASEISHQLMAGGLAADMPAMLVVDGTRPTEERHFTTLAQLGSIAAKLYRSRPTLIVIGRVVELAEDRCMPLEHLVLEQVSHA